MHNADFVFEINQSSFKGADNSYCPAFWIGDTKFEGTLLPNKQVILTATALFTQKGVYDIACYKMKTEVFLPAEFHRQKTVFSQVPDEPSLVQIC